MYYMLQICSRDRVLNVFFREPTTKHTLKELSLKAKLSHTSVKNLLNELLKEKLIREEIEKKGKRNFPVYFSNFEEESFKFFKKLNNLMELNRSNLIKVLQEEFFPKSIVLFGSYSQGEDIEESDIDLFLESSPKEFDTQKYEKRVGRKINLLFSENFNKLNKNLKQNILNGIVLQGAIEI